MVSVITQAERRRTGPSRGGFWFVLTLRLKKILGLRDADIGLRESLEDIIEEHEDHDEDLTVETRVMLKNVLNFGEIRVEDVMVPRADITAIDETSSLNKLLKSFHEAAHSRLPVYRETLDDPVGMIHIKDMIGLLRPDGELNEAAGAGAGGNGGPAAKLLREVLFVPPSMPVADLFLKMQASRIHMALVIDEYGGTDGLVTIEDLVEEIVGEIEDEHDTEQSPQLKRTQSGNYIADARVPIELLEAAVGLDLVPEDRKDYVDTVGGLVFSLVGRVPQRGELISHPDGLDFEVTDADPRRVKRVRIIINGNPSSDDSECVPGDTDDSLKGVS